MAMALKQIWVLGESRLSFPDGGELDGVTQGDGSHLVGRTLRLDGRDLQRIDYTDNDDYFEDNDRSQKLAGEQTFDGETYADGMVIEAEYCLVLRDPGTGQTWEAVGVNFNEGGGPAYGTVEGLAFVGPPGALPPAGVDLEIVEATEGPRNLATDAFVAPVCFAAGTRIATPLGPVAVERLAPGDRVLLAEGGTAPVRRCLVRTLSAAEVGRDPRLRPVRIAAGALGRGLPERDLVVSRQHRLLAASPIVRRMFGVDEVLIAAHRLTALPGIALDEAPDARPGAGPDAGPDGGLTYVHLVLDAHRVILAEGAPTESFHAGPMALRALPPALAAEIRLLFPEAAAETTAPHPGPARTRPARTIPAGRRQSRCVARHLNSRTPLLAAPAAPVAPTRGTAADASGCGVGI